MRRVGYASTTTTATAVVHEISNPRQHRLVVENCVRMTSLARVNQTCSSQPFVALFLFAVQFYYLRSSCSCPFLAVTRFRGQQVGYSPPSHYRTCLAIFIARKIKKQHFLPFVDWRRHCAYPRYNWCHEGKRMCCNRCILYPLEYLLRQRPILHRWGGAESRSEKME